VQGGQRLQALGAALGQGKPHGPSVPAIWLARDQPGRLGPVDQLDGAVVPYQQVPGHVPDGRAAGLGVPPDRQQELMLRRVSPAASACWPLQRRKRRKPVRKASSRS
jgi:hypothetical protein